MAMEWSNWEDSRQCPIGHPTLPLRYVYNFHDSRSNLLQQQDTIPPWTQHVQLGGWKDSGVVPSSTRNLEMYNSHCCCYLYGPCPVAAAGTREILPRSNAHGYPIHPPQISNCPSQQLQEKIVSNSCWVLPLLLILHFCCCCCCCGVVQCP